MAVFACNVIFWLNCFSGMIDATLLVFYIYLYVHSHHLFLSLSLSPQVVHAEQQKWQMRVKREYTSPSACLWGSQWSLVRADTINTIPMMICAFCMCYFILNLSDFICSITQAKRMVPQDWISMSNRFGSRELPERGL